MDDVGGLGGRNGLGHENADPEGALVQLGQKLGAEEAVGESAAGEQKAGSGEDKLAAAHGEAQHRAVKLDEFAHDPRVALLRPAPHREAKQRGHDKHGEDRAGHQGIGQRQGHGTEDAPLDTLQREDGNEGGQEDGLGEEDGPAHFADGLHNRARKGLRLVFPFVQDANQVFGDDHGGIDNDAEVNRAHGDEVGGNAAQVQQQVCAQQRHRHGQGHDQGGAVVAQPEK